MAETRNRKAVIVGGGPGGLATAVALRRLEMDVKVLERVNDLRKIQVGGAYVLWNNATRALKELGLADRILEVSSRPLEHFELRSWQDRPLVYWPVGEIGRELGLPTVGATRPAVHQVLEGTLGAGVLELGARVTGFTQDKEGATAQVSGGREEHGDLLISADGGQSNIRTQYFDKSELNYTGYMLWHGVLEFEHEMGRTGIFREYWGPGARFVLYPVGEKQMYWSGIVNAEKGSVDPPEGAKAVMRQRYAGWPRPIPDVIEAIDEETIKRRHIFGRTRPAARWGEGRVTLLGDAAHPMTFNLGQGACQTFEDAVILMNALSREPDLVAGLRAYETKRATRVAPLMQKAWRIGSSGRLVNRFVVPIREVGMWRFGSLLLKQHRQDMAVKF
jgi:2-polyprenyl-6-methoxyphenol hydroxylase-like FAD-dependent oxidoreductase